VARQGVGPAGHQRRNAQQLHCLLERHAALRLGHTAAPVVEVAPHIEVGKQAGLLEHIGQGPPVHRHENPGGIVLPGGAVDHQPADVGTLQPGDAAQQRGFA
jgi:hypothetical protein